MRQIGFSFLKNYKKEFGGALVLGKRKGRRPLSTKSPIHLVLKSSHARLFRPDDLVIKSLIKKQARRFGINVYDHAVNWNHIHLLIQIPSRESYVRFIRAVTSGIVAIVSSKCGSKIAGIFTLRPFTKILTWGKQFESVLHYHVLNNIEAIAGKRSRQRFTGELREMRSWVKTGQIALP